MVISDDEQASARARRPWTPVRWAHPRRVGAAGIVAALAALTGAACDPTPSPSALYTRACNQTLTSSSTGPVGDPAIIEASGIVASRAQPGIYWVHNDSGDTNRIFAIDATTGARRATYTLTGATNTDFEDIALGPGPLAGRDYLYVGDIGDNTRTRTEIQVLRFAEPTLAPGVTARSVAVDTLRLRYPNGARNAESLIVDPRSGALTVLMKRVSTEAIRIYRAPANLAAGSLTTMTDVGRLNLPGTASNATGADMSPDGATILVRTYANVFAYNVAAGATVEAALAGAACPANVAAEPQGEAVAVHPDSLGFVTLSEGANPPLHHRDA